LAEFLDRGYLRAHLSRTLPEYRRRRDALVEGLLANLPAGLSFRTPEHGLVLWLPLPEPLSPDLVFEEAQRHGVLVSPGTLQAVDPRLSRGVRMTYCSEPPERIKEGARRLGEALRALFRRHQKDGPVDATAIGSV
jgi:DNA-binding transcriptional MocR family regulator